MEVRGYRNFQSVLDAALGEFAGEGFRLREDGDHFLLLEFGGSVAAVFNQHKATHRDIQKECALLKMRRLREAVA